MIKKEKFYDICLHAIIVFFFMSISVMPAFAEESASQIRAGDILCFGTPDEVSGFDGKWLVLDPNHTNTGEEGMFVVALNLIGDDRGEPLLFRDIGDVSVSFSDRGEAFAQAHPGSTDYQGSDIQQWCAAFPARYLGEAEQQALIPTVKSDDGIAIPGFGIPLPGASSGTVDFDPVEGILNGDTVFLLSAEEATNPDYGFADHISRVALYKGTSSGYWLRSPHIPTFPLDVGFVFSFGAVMDYPVNAHAMFPMSTYARPACNLDRTRITGLEKQLVADNTTVWRVSFQGGGNNEEIYDLTLPEVGNVVDVQSMIKTVIVVVSCVLITLILVITWLIVRKIRKRRTIGKIKRYDS